MSITSPISPSAVPIPHFLVKPVLNPTNVTFKRATPAQREAINAEMITEGKGEKITAALNAK